ncbi:MAG: outer membrane beta-barrel protein [Verrucomicrobia bacterium]|nr:outer membrane beta-barrel protein [Verrucomicrobiota bacterium]
MKYNAWTLALIGAGVVSLPAVVHAEEKGTNAVLSALSATTISGYVDTSAQWNPGTGNANLPVYTPNGVQGASKADGFNLDVVALTISKPVGEGEWGAGYNATLLFGPDATGYNPSYGTTGSDFSLKDAYVDLRAPLGNGLDLKLGTFAEILGYEVYETGNNPNYTRSYGYEIEPLALTGLLAAYQFSPVISAQGGVANTWSTGINNRSDPPKAESYKAYIGGVTLTAPDSLGFLAGSTLAGGVINGFDAGASQATKTSFYVGGTMKTPLKCLSVGIAYDYVALANATTFGENGDTVLHNSGYQNASSLYLLWQATEKLTFNTRGEYFSQSQYLVGSGMPSQAFAVTETVQYDLWKNVISRLEFRWDHSASGQDAYGGTQSGSPSLKNAFLVAANLIYKF